MDSSDFMVTANVVPWSTWQKGTRVVCKDNTIPGFDGRRGTIESLDYANHQCVVSLDDGAVVTLTFYVLEETDEVLDGVDSVLPQTNLEGESFMTTAVSDAPTTQTAAKKRPGRPKVSGRKSSSVERLSKSETTEQALRRLARRDKGVTAHELMKSRGSRMVGPFQHSINLKIRSGDLTVVGERRGRPVVKWNHDATPIRGRGRKSRSQSASSTPAKRPGRKRKAVPADTPVNTSPESKPFMDGLMALPSSTDAPHIADVVESFGSSLIAVSKYLRQSGQ